MGIKYKPDGTKEYAELELPSPAVKIAKQEIAAAKDDSERINAIIKYLGL